MIIFKLLNIIFSIIGILFLCVVVLTIKNCSTNPYVDTGWSEEILDGDKGYIIAEFPNATNEQRSQILILRAEIERLKFVRDGHLDPDWRPSKD